MSDFMMEREIQEALTAGENALQSLYAASEQLDSARNWGIVDLLGGGFFTDLIKHSKMDGVVADYLVQSRINETRRKVAEAIRRVEELTAKLRAKYSYFN